MPYFSRGWRDDAVQRRFLEAALGYWAEPANNPMSGVYSGRMIITAETAAWTWDARTHIRRSRRAATSGACGSVERC